MRRGQIKDGLEKTGWAGHNVTGERPLLSFEGWYKCHGLLANLAIKLSVPLLQNDQEPAPVSRPQHCLWNSFNFGLVFKFLQELAQPIFPTVPFLYEPFSTRRLVYSLTP